MALGTAAEICSPGGFGWERRLTLMRPGQAAQAGDSDRMARAYGVRTDAVAKAPARVIAILGGISRQLERQRAVDPALIRHRDMVWERHIGLPMEF